MLAEKICFTDEPIVTTLLQIKHSDSSKNYSLELEIYVQPAAASIKCVCCKKTTRDILGSFDILLPTDDSLIDVLGEVKKILNHTSVFESTHVSIITDVAIIVMYEEGSHKDASDSTAAFCIEQKLQKILNGTFICDGCLTPEYVEEKLKEG